LSFYPPGRGSELFNEERDFRHQCFQGTRSSDDAVDHSDAGSPKHVLGVANIRGQIIPVIDLPSVVGRKSAARNILLVTE
jgi:two-component system chemotaxis response regulator CheV